MPWHKRAAPYVSRRGLSHKDSVTNRHVPRFFTGLSHFRNGPGAEAEKKGGGEGTFSGKAMPAFREKMRQNKKLAAIRISDLEAL
jgi:hypothetical protein